jgi:hypothetical protein
MRRACISARYQQFWQPLHRYRQMLDHQLCVVAAATAAWHLATVAAWVGNQLEALASTAQPLAVQLAGIALQDMNGLGLATGAAVTAGMAAGQVTQAAGQALVAAGTALQNKKLKKQAKDEARKAANMAKLKQLLHLGKSKTDKASSGAVLASDVSLAPQGAGLGGAPVVAGAQNMNPAMMYQPLPRQGTFNVGGYEQAAGESVQYSQAGPATSFAYSQTGDGTPYTQSSQQDIPQYSQTSGTVPYARGSGELPAAQCSQTSTEANSIPQSGQGSGQGLTAQQQKRQELQRLQQYSLPSETDNGMMPRWQ